MTASPSLPPSDSGRPTDEPFEIILEEDVLPRGTFDLRTMRSVTPDRSAADDHSSALVRQSWHQGLGSLLRFLAGAAAIVGMLLLAVHVYSKRAHQAPASEEATADAGDVEPIPVTTSRPRSIERRNLDQLPHPGGDRGEEGATETPREASPEGSEAADRELELAVKVSETGGVPPAGSEPVESTSTASAEPPGSALPALPADLAQPDGPSSPPLVEASRSVDPTAEPAAREASSSEPTSSETAPAEPSPAVRFARALERERTGDLEGARVEYARLLAEDFEHVGAHYRLGLLDQRAGQLDSAAAHYRAAVEADPEHAPSWNNLSVIAWQAGDVATARSAVRRAIEAEPELVDAWSNRGWMALEIGERGAARRDLEHALTLDSELPEVRYNLALLDLQEGRLDEAERHLDVLTERAPTSWEAETRELRGRLAEERGERPEALRHYAAAQELAPGRPTVLAALARLQAAEGRAELAWRHTRELLEVAPEQAETHRVRARVLMALEDWEGARSSWEQALELEPDTVEDVYHLALASERAGVMPEALRRYEEVMEIDADHVPTLINLSRFYLEAERPETALEYLERAKTAAPDNLLVQINRGIAYRDLGRRDEARSVLASAVDRQRAEGEADPALVDLVESLSEGETAVGAQR